VPIKLLSLRLDAQPKIIRSQFTQNASKKKHNLNQAFKFKPILNTKARQFLKLSNYHAYIANLSQESTYSYSYIIMRARLTITKFTNSVIVLVLFEQSLNTFEIKTYALCSSMALNS